MRYYGVIMSPPSISVGGGGSPYEFHSGSFFSFLLATKKQKLWLASSSPSCEKWAFPLAFP